MPAGVRATDVSGYLLGGLVSYLSSQTPALLHVLAQTSAFLILKLWGFFLFLFSRRA